LKRDVAAQDAFDEVPENWRSTTMRKLTTIITSGSRGWAKYYCDEGAFFIRAQDINTDNLQLENVAHVNQPAGAEGRRTRVNTGDLLITITGANVTKAALVRGEIPEAYISQHVALVRLSNIEWGGFLYLWIISPAHGRKELLKAAYGAGKPGLNLDNIRELVVALPPEPEQHEIVRRVEALFRLADAIEARVAAATTRADRLTQAILAKAFRGELVPTEAELARREGRDYEPASVLLERIKEERRQSGGMRPGRNTSKKSKAVNR
jgi:type I restriction enzyme S subunit